MTGYDEAIAVAKTESEKNRLRDLRLALNIPPDSPEWGFYAILAPVFGRELEEKRLGAAVESVTEAAQLLRAEARPSSGPVTLAPESLAAIERIEERLGQLPTVRMIEPLFVRSNDDPIAASARDLTVFVIAALASVAVVRIAVEPWLQSPILLISVFALGVCFSMGWLWLWPIVSPVIERRRQKRR